MGISSLAFDKRDVEEKGNMGIWGDEVAVEIGGGKRIK